MLFLLTFYTWYFSIFHFSLLFLPFYTVFFIFPGCAFELWLGGLSSLVASEGIWERLNRCYYIWSLKNRLKL